MSVIKVENLSKKYIISHQRQERYTALRDVMARGVKRMFNRGIVQPFKRLTSSSTVQQFPSSTTEEFYALKDVSFEINQGERVGIIGRNGAGKTTLLKLLSRITEPTTGRITLKGRVASLLEVGTGFHPELTGRENIFLNGAILGMGKAEIKKKFDEIVDFAEIEKFLDTPVKRYSSGMYVRLAFAVAAHLEPEILLVDEVLAVGDAQFQKKCLGKMQEIGESGRTILFVSHNMSAISELCNNGMVLSAGAISYNGNVEDAVTKYMTRSDYGDNRIISRAKYFNDKLILNSLTVNGRDEGYIYLNKDENKFYVLIKGFSNEELKLSVEAKLYDSRGNVIGIYSPGHIHLNILNVPKGKFGLRAEIILPDMTKGDYVLDLYLLNPGYEFFCAIDSAVTVSKGSYPIKTSVGGVFESRLGYGALLLGGNVELAS